MVAIMIVVVVIVVALMLTVIVLFSNRNTNGNNRSNIPLRFMPVGKLCPTRRSIEHVVVLQHVSPFAWFQRLMPESRPM